MAVSLRDVAAEAECSIATASRALAGNRSISAATRQRVEATARRLGYEANGVARALRTQASQLIGLVLPRVEAYNYTASTAQLHDVLAGEGYELVLHCHNDDPVLDRTILRRLLARRVDGVIHVPCSQPGASSVFAARIDIPVVELLRKSDWAEVDGVTTDLEAASYELTRHLTDLGHRRIALVSGQGFVPSSNYNDRVDGFRRAIADAALDASACPMHVGQFDIAAGRSAATSLLEMERAELPTAIVTGSAPLALGLLEEFQKARLKIPGDVSVVSLANVEWAAATNPPLTTFEIPLAEMGMLAAQMLLNRIRPQVHTDPKPTRALLSGRLVPRDSSAPPTRA